jgi:hypothetical protein
VDVEPAPVEHGRNRVAIGQRQHRKRTTPERPGDAQVRPGATLHQHDVGALGDGDQHPQAERRHIPRKPDAGRVPSGPEDTGDREVGPDRVVQDDHRRGGEPQRPRRVGRIRRPGPDRHRQLPPLDADLGGRLHDQERVTDGCRAE